MLYQIEAHTAGRVFTVLAYSYNEAARLAALKLYRKRLKVRRAFAPLGAPLEFQAYTTTKARAGAARNYGEKFVVTELF